MRNIVLIGFMGTGKTAVGRRLAFCLNRTFIDMDWEIERLCGKKVTQIFALYGEKRFRSEEALLIEKLSGASDLVIATGGGTVLNPYNVTLLRKNGILIALTADLETIYRRVRGKHDRPLLIGKRMHLREHLAFLLDQRKEIYSVAQYTVSTENASPWETAKKIAGYIKAGS